eukprot:231606_1
MAQQVVPKLDAVNSTSVLKERVELFIKCHDIIQLDLLSKSDPFVVVYLKSSTKKSFEEIGRTEVIHDNHFPEFTKPFVLDYYFEEEQMLRFDAYDEDKKGSQQLDDHQIIGSCTMPLGEIIHEQGCTIAKKLMHNGKSLKNKQTKNYTHLIVSAEKVTESGNEEITLQFSCKGLPKMDGFFGKCDPFFVVKRLRGGDDNETVKVYGDRNNYVSKSLNPVFKPFTIQTQTLCNNDEYRPIIISLYDWDPDGGDDYIGSVETSLNALKTKPKGEPIKKNTKRLKNKTFGVLNVDQYTSRPLSSFLDYLQGAVDMSLMIGIDFTASNGDPRDPASLHHFTSTEPSSYQKAIRQIGNILSVYDTDQRFPVWGFGAHFNNVWVGGTEYWNGVSHAFNLNFNLSNPEVNGITGIEQAYTSAISKNIFQLAGPSRFADILGKAKSVARVAHEMTMKDKQNNKIQYFIFLIITDGAITDMRQTRNQIVEIANEYLPLSVVIVGVGNANFGSMNELDADEHGLINSQGISAKRDVVQFVPMNKYKDDLNGLSKETLREIPNQFLSYVQHHKIKPGQRIPPQKQVIDDQFKMSEEEVKQQEILPQPQLQGSNSYWDHVPLPTGWERGYDGHGKIYYVNHVNGTTQWTHPSAY